MEETIVCDICGCELDAEDGTWVDDELLCETCVHEHCVTCDHCGDSIWANTAVQDDYSTLCAECFDNHHHRCECCGRILHNIRNKKRDMLGGEAYEII